MKSPLGRFNFSSCAVRVYIQVHPSFWGGDLRRDHPQQWTSV